MNINLFVETMPFGGVGPAGMGHYYGKYGFDMLTHAKSMLISPPDVAIDVHSCSRRTRRRRMRSVEDCGPNTEPGARSHKALGAQR